MSRVKGRAARLAVLLGTLGAGSNADAHERSLSFSRWQIDGREATVTARISDLDLSRIPQGIAREPSFVPYVTSRLELFSDGERCEPAAEARVTRSGDGQTSLAWMIRCPHEAELRIRSRLFAESSSTHLHLVRVRRNGAELAEHVLSAREREWPIAGRRAAGTTIAGYLRLGVEHILGGYDHLAFVIGLLLVAGSVGSVVRVVTGFTLAHSLTLGLSVGGILRIDPKPVEALIGLSIALVAAENLWRLGSRGLRAPSLLSCLLLALGLVAPFGTGRVPALTLGGFALFTICYFALLDRTGSAEALRAVVAFVFGLLHGLGFAAVLLDAEMPAGRLAKALLGFNAGVELGQLGVVALVWAALRLLSESRRTTLVELGSGAVLALGTFWFVSRTFG